MKTILGLSLVLNIVLGAFLLFRKPEVVTQERLIIESHAQKNEEQKTPVSSVAAAPQKNTAVTDEAKSPATVIHGPHDVQEVQDVGEKMEQERAEFMTQELGMTEEKMAEHNRIRNEYFQQSAKFWENKDPMREPTFEERRKMIDLEEKLHKNLEKLHGKKNWEKYQKFRESYNKKGFKKQVEENQPFVFMGF